MLKRIIPVATALTLFAGAASAQEGKPVKSLEDFFSMIVGKTLSYDLGHQTFHADGNSTGVYKGGKFTGNWMWEGTTYCQFINWKGQRQWNDCGRSMVVKGNVAHITRGNGSKYTMKIMEK